MNKPIITNVSEENFSTIIYGCPRCDATFALYGDREYFCHKCGLQLDWTGLASDLSDKLAAEWKNYVMEENIVGKFDLLARLNKGEH